VDLELNTRRADPADSDKMNMGVALDLPRRLCDQGDAAAETAGSTSGE
jgi:hypothetical protein